jgi:hypothetical protein
VLENLYRLERKLGHADRITFKSFIHSAFICGWQRKNAFIFHTIKPVKTEKHLSLTPKKKHIAFAGMCYIEGHNDNRDKQFWHVAIPRLCYLELCYSQVSLYSLSFSKCQQLHTTPLPHPPPHPHLTSTPKFNTHTNPGMLTDIFEFVVVGLKTCYLGDLENNLEQEKLLKLHTFSV